MGRKLNVLLLLLLLAGLIALSCNTDPTVFGWLEECLNFFGLNTPELRYWVIYHPKLWHVIYYFIFSCVAMNLVRRPWWVAPLLVFALGIVLEFAQVFVPTRSAQVGDPLFNLAGILLAACWVLGVRKLRKCRHF